MSQDLGCQGLRPSGGPDTAAVSALEGSGDSGRALAEQVKQLRSALAEETVTSQPADTVAELPGILDTLTTNVDTRRLRHSHGPRGHDRSGNRNRPGTLNKAWD